MKTANELVSMAKELIKSQEPIPVLYRGAEIKQENAKAFAKAVIESLADAEIVRWQPRTMVPESPGDYLVRIVLKRGDIHTAVLGWRVSEWMTIGSEEIILWAELPGGLETDCRSVLRKQTAGL